MEPTSRDSYETADRCEHDGWVSIRTIHRNNNGELRHVIRDADAAITWANKEFGDEFFSFGGRMFFANEQHLMLFKLRWL